MSEIVVGFDLSPQSTAALNWAADQAVRIDLPLRVIAVMDWVEWVEALGSYGYTWDVLGKADVDGRLAAYKAEVARRFTSVDPKPDWILEYVEGKRPGKVLVSSAAQRGAVLLVVGTREHTGLDRIISGSVSHYCLNHATCPVVAVCAEPAPADADDAQTAPEKAATESTVRS